MKRTLISLAMMLLAGAIGVVTVPSGRMHAQGYSGALPNVSISTSGLTITYSAGSVSQGGAVQAITAGTLTATDAQTSCAAPGYTSCNFVYWASSTALLQTTSASTAFAVGNVVVSFCTTTGGHGTTCTPASWSPSTAAVNTLRPTGSDTGGAYWIAPGNCWYSVATGTLTTPTFGAAPDATALGLNVVGASHTPVMQVSTTNAAAISTNTITCLINPSTRVGVTGRGVNLVDAQVFYGIQGTGGVNATQVAVLASGSMNGTVVFTKIAFPTAGASETPSTVTPARADSGTLAISPAVASFNSLVTTAGAFFTSGFTPATPFALNTDLTNYYINFTVLCNTTQATTINVAGVLIHFTT